MMFRRTTWRGPSARRWHLAQARARQIEREVAEFRAFLNTLDGA